MFDLIKINKSKPFEILEDYYKKAIKNNQKSIEAISISSYNHENQEVSSRMVNLKYIKNDKLVFFSNYNSKKAVDFFSHNQVSVLIYWNNINLQIRMKAVVRKLDNLTSDRYFKDRDLNKNALAISSNQSSTISSYEEVIKKYKSIKSSADLYTRPSYWGGFELKPYEIEFWEGHKSRLNKRDLYSKVENDWKHTVLEP